MRKYIHKFKNYTSVEVDNLHDLKEGDLALYEDKFVTRNNGKVEDVVKSGGGSGKEEYSTDYPDDFYLTYWTDGTGSFNSSYGYSPKHLSIYKNNTVIFDSLSNLIDIIPYSEKMGGYRLEFNIPNIDLDSVVLIYKIYDGYDEGNLLTTGIKRGLKFMSINSNIGLSFTYMPSCDYCTNTVSIEFKQKDNPTKYLVDIGPLAVKDNTVINYTAKTSYKVLRIKYTDIIGTY